ncbi:MAG: HAMP domain-containing histidine kinase [Synergistaceae bacterium]|jgi:signal transduction histidine kinase|nr:HAMP domain-containing histidine kinase [Synergistaceae bacterium]
MLENQSLLPVAERGAFKRILFGIFFLLIDWIGLYYGNLYIAHVTERLREREFGPMFFGSSFSLLVHGSQVLLLLLGWVLIGKGVGYYFRRVELAISLVFSSIGIWATWTVLPLLSNRLRYTFPLSLFIMILLLALFQLLTMQVENWVDKGAAILLWVYSFQSLELLPSFPTNTQALSTLFQGMYRSNEEVAIASMTGTALFLSFMAGAMTSTWLLTRYSIRLRQVRQLWENEQQRASMEKDGLREISMVDMRSLVHDLRNPLAAIKGMSLMLQSEKLNEGTPEKAEIMLKAANYMEHMIGEILHEDRQSIVKVESFFDNLEKHIRPFPWSEYFSIVMAPDAAHLLLSLNEIRFMRALLNILDNAWRANLTAGAKDIVLRVRSSGCYLEIEVLDNGPGPGSVQNHAYQKSGWGSTGLGLAFTRKVVTAHGGNLVLMPRTDNVNGASVLISLPTASPSLERADPANA